MRCFTKVLTASLCLFLASIPPVLAVDVASAPAGARAAAQRFGDLPLSFEANQGQTDSQVQFVSRGSGYSFFLTHAGAVLSFSRDGNSDPVVLQMQLAGANTSAPIRGLGQLPGASNYFFGSDSRQWRTGVPTFAKVEYENVYPGVNLVYYGNQKQLEYDFVLAPGADPHQIRLSVSGAQKLHVDSQGNLILSSAAGDVQLLAPKVYQQIKGQQQKISGQWTLAGNIAGFRLGQYDRTQPLVIDPVMMYSSFLGGSQKNSLSRIAIDAAGNAYVAGYTSSGDFPAAPTPMSMTFGSGTHSRGAFVAKIDSTGSNLIYSTYLSGSADEEATGLAIDKQGNVYVAGNTHSTDFPTLNALQSTCGTKSGTCSSAFLTKISPTGNALVFSTYLGGSGAESARSLAVDSKGNAYLAGITTSADFPVTSGAAQTKCGGSCQQNAFVAKFTADGSRIAYATYLGGSGSDDAADLAVDASGNVFVAGHTTSPDFPLSSAFQKGCTADAASANACIATAFVTKIKPNGSAFAYSTYLGGKLGSQASAIAIDSLGSAYVTGSTQSADFPTLKAYQKSCGLDAASKTCSVDAFLTKFSPDGKSLVYSTYFGGAGRDEASGIVVDSSNTAFVVGRTESADLPTAASLQSKLKGASDAFVARFSTSGDKLAFSTYHGGTAAEAGKAIAIDRNRNIYVAGETSSADFPTRRPFQSSCAGACASAFVTKMSLPPAGTPATIDPASGTTPQSAVVNAAYTTDLAVVVLDSGSNPVSGVVVTFTAPSTGASGIFTDSSDITTTATTDVTGTATAAVFTANPFAGAYTVTASIASPVLSTTFDLTNTAGTVNKVTFVGGTSPQTAVVNSAFTNNLAVLVQDAGNNPLGGLTVTFTAPNTTTAASGTFTNGTNTVTAVTDATGHATATAFTADAFTGSYTATGATGGKSANFALTNSAGTVNTVTAVSGTTPQSATVNNAFTNDLAVTVLDAASKPLGGLTVTFTAPSTGPSGTFSDTSTETTTAVTDKNGVATAVAFSANSLSGSYTATGATGGKSANFSLTNSAGTVNSVTAVSGTTPQSVAVNGTFANDLAVTVKDAANKPLGNVTVTFTGPAAPTAPGGTFSDSTTNTTTATTDKNGLATAAPFTADPFGGAYTVTGTAGGKTANFSLTNTSGTVATVTPVAGTTPQSAVANNAFANNLAVTVLDGASKPLGGLTVTFTAPTSTTSATGSFASGASTTATTDKNGVATATAFTANPFAGGPYTVTGATGGKTGNFSLTNTAGTVGTVTATSGTPQSAPVGTAFASPLVVTVVDGASKPLGGLTVTFTAPPTGPTCAFSSGATTTATTDINGTATSSTCTANTLAGGPYAVSGATGGKSDSFQLTNNPGAPHTITVTTGSTPQIIQVGNVYTTAMGGNVTDTFGNPVHAGVSVTLSAPGSGASGTFSLSGTNTTTISTNSSGNFTASAFTANGTAGSYNVTATSATGTATVNYAFTNTSYAFSPAPTGTVYIQGSSTPLTTGTIVTVTAQPTPSGSQPSYTGTVVLTCVNASLPSGVTCPSFTPASATFTNGGPASSVQSALAIATDPATPVGLYPAAAVGGSDSSTIPVNRQATFGLAVQCTMSIQQTTPVFTPAGLNPNQFSIGMSVVNGGSACPYGGIVLPGGITPQDATGDGTVVTTIDSGKNGTLASGGAAGLITFELAPASSTPATGGLTVGVFDATAASGDVTNFGMPVSQEAQVSITVVQGGTVAPFPLNATQAPSGTLNIPNANLSGVTTVCGVVDHNGNPDSTGNNFGITCSATASTGAINLAVSLPAASAALHPHQRGSAMLLALGMGFPAIVFLGVGASALAPVRRKRGINRIVCILGILLVLSTLVILPACGGGFKATFITNSTNTYTLTTMAYVTDGSNNVIGIDVFSVLLTVQ